MLIEILQELDSLELYNKDRKNSLVPFLLLDEHQLYFHLKFLEHINNEKHTWNICLGGRLGIATSRIAHSKLF